MSCPECTRLLARSMALERAHFTAFGSMIEASAGPESEFAVLTAATDKARNESDVARLELQRHQQGHAKENLKPGRDLTVHGPNVAGQ
jgi:hypothetical protein